MMATLLLSGGCSPAVDGNNDSSEDVVPIELIEGACAALTTCGGYANDQEKTTCVALNSEVFVYLLRIGCGDAYRSVMICERDEPICQHGEFHGSPCTDEFEEFETCLNDNVGPDEFGNEAKCIQFQEYLNSEECSLGVTLDCISHRIFPCYTENYWNCLDQAFQCNIDDIIKPNIEEMNRCNEFLTCN